MNDYAPASSLGWLDLDTVASERVASLLRSLEEPGTIDALGLGSIRDTFSELLTPGTSTVQTRLRYFIFLPWIFQRLEAEGVPPASFARKLRDYEAKLIDCLRHLGPNQGVIGRVAGRALRRMPSDVYWGSMMAWGIRRLDLSIAEYGRQARALGRFRPERDDDGSATEPAGSIWASVPEMPENFPAGQVNFELEPDEAQMLTDGIRRRHPDTLIAALTEARGLSLDYIDYPWFVPVPRLPSRLVEMLHHARCFSELTHGPQLVYNLLLARAARKELGWDTEELEASQKRHLDGWSDLVGRRHDELRAWVESPHEFRRLLAGHGIAQSTLHYWDAMARHAVDDPEQFAERTQVHRLIRDRERRLKSKRARLSHRAALENWNQMPFGGQLDYRWGITKTYLRDLAAAGVPG